TRSRAPRARLGLAQRFAERIRVVQVEDHALLRGGDFKNFLGVSPDNAARASLARRVEQFLIEPARKDDRVAPSGLKRGQDDELARAIEFLNEFTHKGWGDQRMVHQAEQDSIGAPVR